MQKFWKYVFLILFLITILIWFSIFTYPNQNLKLIACDVGQGDAILVIQGSTQIMIDGGPNNKILDCLSDHIPFYDRKIEAVMISHPQKDHYGGIIDVIERYDVQTLIATELDSVSQEWQVLESKVRGKGIRVINPLEGMGLSIGLIHLDVLHPPKEAFLASENSMPAPASGSPSGQAPQSYNGVLGTFTSNKDPNEFSIVAILSYYDFDALFTGDIGPELSDKIAERFVTRASQGVEYIKIPHHGSKNGLSAKLLDEANPQVAVISVGKNNSYGHPHEEVIKMLKDKGIRILRTDDVGDIVIESNGEKIQVR